MVGCGGGGPCDRVLNSRWSMIAGTIPVSGLSMGTYLAMVFAVFFIGPNSELPIRRLSWKVMLVLAGAIAGGAIWFTIIQKWIIGEFCLYCMTTHITGVIIASLVFWRAIKDPESYSFVSNYKNIEKAGNVSKLSAVSAFRPLHATVFLMSGLILAGILAGSQIGLASSSIYLDGESQEDLSAFDSNEAPMVGSTEAQNIVTLLFDYNCPHCQTIHFMLNEAVRKYDGKLAFVLCPTPLNTNCNPYVPGDVDAFKNSCELAKTGLAVWRAKREVFPAFENWMFTYETGDRWHPRSLETARAKAIELVGKSAFIAAMSDPWIERYLQSCVQIFGQTLQNGKGGIPKLIFGSRWVIPEPQSPDDLIQIMQGSLALPKP